MTALEWIFDPLPPSGALQGGNASLHVFRPDLETFVREVLQNSRDQRTGSTVRVVFTFEQLTGAAKTEFLQAIGWGQLRHHASGAADSRYAQISTVIKDGLRSVDADEPLVILRIDDVGTRGLEGAEDDRNDNFNALCRNTLVSRDSAERGGSYGLGKAVLWRFSSIFTVLFSSRIAGNPRPGFRLFGRAELPFHEALGKGYAGAGWFGHRQELDYGKRAISGWDDEVAAQAKRARLDRDPDLGTGTSIMVVGFREPQEETVRPVRTIAQELSRIAARWFWPSLQRGELAVEVTARENGRTVFEEAVQLTAEVAAFAQGVTAAETKQPPLQPGDVAEMLIPFKVPGRKDPSGPPVEAQVRLLVRRTQDGAKSDLTNRVALTRGAGMVVQYRQVRGAGERSFHAVLLAGRANGDTPEDQAVEAFLRAAEPPAHDEWVVTPRVRSEYKTGYLRELQGLWLAIDQKVARLFEEQTADYTPGPSMLAKLFNVSSPEGQPVMGKGAKFTVQNLQAFFDGAVWQFSGRVTRATAETRPWKLTIELSLAGESGTGVPVRIAELDVDEGSTSVAGTEGTIDIPAEVARVSFSGTSVLMTDITDTRIARRTRLDIDVRPAF